MTADAAGPGAAGAAGCSAAAAASEGETEHERSASLSCELGEPSGGLSYDGGAAYGEGFGDEAYGETLGGEGQPISRADDDEEESAMSGDGSPRVPLGAAAAVALWTDALAALHEARRRERSMSPQLWGWAYARRDALAGALAAGGREGCVRHSLLRHGARRTLEGLACEAAPLVGVAARLADELHAICSELRRLQQGEPPTGEPEAGQGRFREGSGKVQGGEPEAGQGGAAPETGRAARGGWCELRALHGVAVGEAGAAADEAARAQGELEASLAARGALWLQLGLALARHRAALVLGPSD